MFEPYKTTYGSLINISKLTAALAKYINTVDLNELEYEYPSNTTSRVVYITGYNHDEKELPAWDHPLVMKTLKGETVIVVDVRLYVKSEDEISARLEDIARNKNGLGFVITRGLLTKEFLDGKIGDHREIFKPATTAMGVWLSGMIGTIVGLDPVEMFKVEIITSIYSNTLFYNHEDVQKNMDVIVARVTTAKHAYKFNKKEIQEIASNYRLSKDKLEELITNIAAVLPDSKKDFITIDTVITAMGNIWYGPGDSETPIMALEDMPTWLSILHAVITNRSYSKSRIGTLLSKYNRVIDAKLIAKHIDRLVEDIRVD